MPAQVTSNSNVRWLKVFVFSPKEGERQRYRTPLDFAVAALLEIAKAGSIEDLFAFIERNRSALAQLKSLEPETAILINTLRVALKARAHIITRSNNAEVLNEREWMTRAGPRES